jgi:hypothetical protein
VLFAPFHSDFRKANQEVARIVASRPDRYHGFVFIHPQNDAGRVRQMVAAMVDGHGFCGVKVHRHLGRITREVCEAALSFNLPILYDVVGDVSAIELLATEYPQLNFIIPHLGSFADDWRAQHAFLDYLERHPNVFTDTSGVRRFDLLEQAVERAGAGKILFGSDGPWLHPGVELEKVRMLRLPADQEGLILSGNFLRLVKRAGRRPRPTTGPPEVSIPRHPRMASFPPEMEEIGDPWRRVPGAPE